MNSLKIKTDDYLVEVSNSHTLEELENRWTHIQRGRDLPYFLTWSWISSWITTYKPNTVMVTATHDNQLVAVGIFTLSLEQRHVFVKSRQLRLHQMGDTLLDQIWMEYNDFLCIPEHQHKATNACLKTLQKHYKDIDEIIISMARNSRAEQILQGLECAEIIVKRPCFAVDLQEIRNKGVPYLNTLHANTRYQIRRSIRHYQSQHGEMSIQIAKDEEQALQFFREAGPLHIKRWDDSGYHNPEFIRFHENLIRENHPRHSAQLMKVLSGHVTIGLIYYHIVNKSVYFYLHGLLYEHDPQLKPGLVAHAMATQYFIDEGMNFYDYMGGYSQYKVQLAKHSEDLATIVIQKPRLRFFLEKLGGKIKHAFVSKH
jgi:hypothetical protein